jgi:hypothetical protein
VTKTVKLPEPGEVFHVLQTGFTVHTTKYGVAFSKISKRGDEITVTPELLEANCDRNGVLAPFLALLHDPEAQLRRWGTQVTAAGSWPREYLKTIPGTSEHEEARQSAHREALAIENATERIAALEAVEQRYGPAPTTSRTHVRYGG